MNNQLHLEERIKSSKIENYLQDFAIVTETIYPYQQGRVRLHGVYWFATGYEYIPAGTPEYPVRVKIIGRRGNTLTVRHLLS